MKTTQLDYLFKVGSPNISLGLGEKGRTNYVPSLFYSSTEVDVCVRQLRGNKMSTTQALMNEFGAALQLFDGFGENWHALEEVLSYLDESLPADGYVLVVERAESLLADELIALPAFLKTVDEAANFWSKPIVGNGRFDRGPAPFHVLLNFSAVGDGPVASMQPIRDAALQAGVALRE